MYSVIMVIGMLYRMLRRYKGYRNAHQNVTVL